MRETEDDLSKQRERMDEHHKWKRTLHACQEREVWKSMIVDDIQRRRREKRCWYNKKYEKRKKEGEGYLDFIHIHSILHSIIADKSNTS